MRERDSCSLAVVERLKRRGDFRAAASGARAAAAAFTLQARRRADDAAVRVGFTVTRHVGNAVERNRMRRRLREMVRLSAAGRWRAGHDYVLIARRPALTAPFAEMVRDLDVALDRIHGSRRAGGGATGGSGRRSLHEAGSPSRPRPPQRRRQSPEKPSPPPHER